VLLKVVMDLLARQDHLILEKLHMAFKRILHKRIGPVEAVLILL